MTELTPALAVVTGATGLVGGATARALAAEGLRVRVLVRDESAARKLAAEGLETFPGDLSDTEAILRAVSGAGLVVHAAALVSDWGPREAFWSANVDGTANVVAACQRAGVSRLVHLGSVTVLGLFRDGRRLDETSPCPRPRPGDFYSESKLAAERIVMDAHGVSGLSTTIVRPGAIWGPGDENVVPRLLHLLRSRAMPYVDGGRNLVCLSHIANLVQGIRLAALSSRAAGEIYHVNDGEEITARQVIDALARAFSLATPRISLPFGLLLALAYGFETGGRLLRLATPPPLTRYGVRFVACDARYPIDKVRIHLGYLPSLSFLDGLETLVRPF